MKKSLLLLSAGLILSSLSLTGCQQGGTPAATTSDSAAATTQGSAQESSSQAETSSAAATSSEDKPVAGRIIVAEDQETASDINKTVLPVDIIPDQVVNLEDHIEVTKVSTWSLTTESKNVKIEGHTFKAVDYGAYTITIVAGTTKRAIHGYVVTPNKIAFDELWGTIAPDHLDYVLGGAMTGTAIVKDDYWMEYDPETANFEGAIRLPKTETYYSFNLPLADDEDGFGEKVVMNKGYGRSHASRGYGENLDLVKPTDFIQIFDEDGDPTGYFVLENSAIDQYGESKVQHYVDSLVGDELWSYYQDNILESDSTTGMPIGNLHLAARYVKDRKTGLVTVTLYPMSDAGVIVPTVTIGKNTYKTDIVVTNIGDAAVPACEDWLENPVVPEAIDLTLLRNAADNLIKEKTYTFSTVAQWVNASTGQPEDVPTYMCFDDGTPVMDNHNVSGAVNTQIVEHTYNYVTPLTYLPDKNIVLPEIGTREVNFVDNTKFYSSSKGPEATEWSSPTIEDFSDDESTIWDSTLTPYFLKVTDKMDLLADASIYDSKVDDETGNTLFFYNTYGNDMNYGRNKYYAGLPFYFASLAPNMLGWIPVFYMNYMNWWTSSTIFFSVSPNGDFSFNWTFTADKNDVYVVSVAFTDIGVDAVSEDAKAFYRATTGKALPGDDEIIPDTSEQSSGEIIPGTSEQSSGEIISVPEDSTPIESNEDSALNSPVQSN